MSDKQRIANSFARRYSEYERAAAVQREMAARLDAALAAASSGHKVRRALEIGIGTGFLTRLLTARYPAAEWWFNDLTPAAFDWIPAGLQQATALPGDAETLNYPPRLDLIASSSALQWFDDLSGFFRKAGQALAKGGMLAVAAFGKQNLYQLSRLAGGRLRYPASDEWRRMAAAAGFHILTEEEWQHTLRFPDAQHILLHLRRTGVNGTSTGIIRTPSQLKAFDEAYRKEFALPDGRLPLTYHPLLLIARYSG